MFKSIESLGAWMLGKLVPTVTASAACEPSTTCTLCSSCYLKRCTVKTSCAYSCSACGGGGCKMSGAISLC